MSKPMQAPNANSAPESAPAGENAAAAAHLDGTAGPPLDELSPPEELFFDGPSFPDEPSFFEDLQVDGADPIAVAPPVAWAPERAVAPRRADRGRADLHRQGQATAQGPVPPADLPAERAILSSCLSDPDSVALAQSSMRAEDFYDPRHKAAFEAICTLALRTEPTDVISVFAELERKGHGDLVGLSYLTDLIGDIGSSYAVEHYAKRVSKLATVRNILAVTHKVQSEGYKRGVDPDSYVQLVEHELAEALKATVRGGPQVVGELVPEVFQGILDARARGGETVGMSTGFKAVDQWHLGLHVTDLIVLAARPAMGKSAFALNLAFNVARNRRRKAQDDYDRARVAVFSLEMGREQLVLRLLSARSGVGLTMLRKGELSPDDEMQLREAAAELAEMAIYLDDTPGLTPGDLRARCKRMEMHGPLDLVVVDYLQLMRGSGGAKQSREQEVAEISRSLKGLAKELQCTVIALSQLNRGLESRADKRPMMSDLRESGSIEQDADIIWFIHREHYYNASAPPHEAELVIAKQRAGATGIIKLHFDGPLTRFGNLDDRANDEWVGGH
jgi:replicative DNA helicase